MIKYLKTLVSATVLTAMFSAFAVVCAAADNGSMAGVVSTASDALMVRNTASKDSAIMSKLGKGNIVTLISKTGDWWRVEYSAGNYGYCHADYITQLPLSRSGYVSTTSGELNIRSGAGMEFSVNNRLSKGRGLIILSENNGWSRVLYDGVTIGYASSQYISDYAQKQKPGEYIAITLSVPDYKQYDMRWASLKIGSSQKNMANIGCVTTTIAELESYRQKNASITPATMLKKLSYNASGDVYWPGNYVDYTSGDYLSMLYKQLSAGKPVIFGAKTAAGRMHWVVVKGYLGGSTLSASGFLINDPGSENRPTLASLLSEYPYFYKLEYYN